MSFSVMDNCWNCLKKDECTDKKNVQDAVQEIHKNCLGQGGHLGSGTIIIMCGRLDSKDK